MTDLLGGRIQIYFDSITTSLPLYREGKIKILAVTERRTVPGRARDPDVRRGPDIPTSCWSSGSILVAPKGTPKEIVEKLNEAVRVALADPEVKKRLEQDAAVLDAEPR